MSFKSPKNKFEEEKREILSAIEEGKLSTTTEPPTSSTGEFWSHLFRIKDLDSVSEPFVQCKICHQILSYEVKKGTNSLNIYVQNCTKKNKYIEIYDAN
jgi:transcription elongation factor Elf1